MVRRLPPPCPTRPDPTRADRVQLVAVGPAPPPSAIRGPWPAARGPWPVAGDQRPRSGRRRNGEELSDRGGQPGSVRRGPRELRQILGASRSSLWAPPTGPRQNFGHFEGIAATAPSGAGVASAFEGFAVASEPPCKILKCPCKGAKSSVFEGFAATAASARVVAHESEGVAVTQNAHPAHRTPCRPSHPPVQFSFFFFCGPCPDLRPAIPHQLHFPHPHGPPMAPAFGYFPDPPLRGESSPAGAQSAHSMPHFCICNSPRNPARASRRPHRHPTPLPLSSRPSKCGPQFAETRLRATL
jgi:hypothetical protein